MYFLKDSLLEQCNCFMQATMVYSYGIEVAPFAFVAHESVTDLDLVKQLGSLPSNLVEISCFV